MPKREIKLLLEDIIENAEMIFQFVGRSTYEEFINDKMKVYAVVRAFEIIGEASKIICTSISGFVFSKQMRLIPIFIRTSYQPYCEGNKRKNSGAGSE